MLQDHSKPCSAGAVAGGSLGPQLLVRHVRAEWWKICFCIIFHLPVKSILGYFILLLLSGNCDLFKGPRSLRWASCMSHLPTTGHCLCLCKGLDPKPLYSAMWLHLLESCLTFTPITLHVPLMLLTLSKVLNITVHMCQDCLRCSLLLQPAIEELSLILCTYPHCHVKSLSETSGK